MSETDAAAYCGISAGLFRREWEPLLRRERTGEKRVLFDRAEIDDILDARRAVKSGGLDLNDPYEAALA